MGTFGFCIKDNNILMEYNNNYKVYNNLSSISFNKKNREEELVSKLRRVLDKNDCVQEIDSFFNSLM